MSQIIVPISGGSVPPVVPTSFQTQNGTATPLLNTLIINGDDSPENNVNGITTKGGVVGTGTTNEVDVILTNRLQGSATTVGATTANIISFQLLSIGTYAIEYRIAAYNTTSTLGSGYSLFGAIRLDVDGITPIICDPTDEINNQEGTMINANASIVVSGTSVVLTGTGYLGQTINWSAVALYTFVGV